MTHAFAHPFNLPSLTPSSPVPDTTHANVVSRADSLFQLIVTPLTNCQSFFYSPVGPASTHWSCTLSYLLCSVSVTVAVLARASRTSPEIDAFSFDNPQISRKSYCNTKVQTIIGLDRALRSLQLMSPEHFNHQVYTRKREGS